MINIDPASLEFERLPRKEQARAYRAIGWTLSAIADEYGVAMSTVGRWLNPERAKREGITRAAWRKTERGRDIYKACERRRIARRRAEEASA